jgi:hypothetical protein
MCTERGENEAKKVWVRLYSSHCVCGYLFDSSPSIFLGCPLDIAFNVLAQIDDSVKQVLVKKT